MLTPDFFALFFEEADEILQSWEKACLELEQGFSAESCEALYRAAHNLKSATAALGLNEFSKFVHTIEDLITSLGSGALTVTPPLMRLLLDAQSMMTTWIKKIKVDQKFYPEAAVRNLVAEVHALAASKPKDQPDSASVENKPTEPLASVAPKDAVSPVAPPVAVIVEPQELKEKPTRQRGESLRVAAERLDELIQLVGELSTQQVIVWQARQNATLQSKSCDNAIQLIQKIAKDLQALALTLRMQPMTGLFQRLERVVRDLARDQGKRVTIEITGDHVEIDKSVVERMADALMHIVRNAVDHGIERPEERLVQGKSEQAVLRIAGRQEASGVMIEISEDGRGLDSAKILAKATQKGLVRGDITPSIADIYQFIFLPGFSTAEAVTNVSGRGVGMDVVKTTVEDLGGSIGIQSVVGAGTSFSISVPATLSIIDALVVSVGKSRYGIPLQDVAEIIDLSQFKLESAASHGRLLSLRHTIVPVERLATHLPKHERAQTGHALWRQSASAEVDSGFANIMPALIVRAGSDTLALQVDHVIGQQPVSVRRLPPQLAKVAGFTGTTILGDGDPCVILSLPAITRRYFDRVGRGHESTLEGNAMGSARFVGSETVEGRYLVFQIGDVRLATPLNIVREILDLGVIATVPHSPPHVIGYVEVRGQVIGVVDLARQLGIARDASGAPGKVVIVEAPGDPVAYLVNRVEAVSNIRAIGPGEPIGAGDSSGGPTAIGFGRYNDHLIRLVDLRRGLDGYLAAVS